jgi:hypothetical protein
MTTTTETTFREEHAELCGWLDSLSTDYDAKTHPFLLDMKVALRRYDHLTERQLAATEKFKARADEFAARKAADAEALKDVEPITEGRYEFEGEVLSTKVKFSQYGEQLKMIVRLDDGNKLWGTVPAALDQSEELHGKRVRLTAEVARSDDDPHFGFFKRPKNAREVS